MNRRPVASADEGDGRGGVQQRHATDVICASPEVRARRRRRVIPDEVMPAESLPIADVTNHARRRYDGVSRARQKRESSVTGAPPSERAAKRSAARTPAVDKIPSTSSPRTEGVRPSEQVGVLSARRRVSCSKSRGSHQRTRRVEPAWRSSSRSSAGTDGQPPATGHFGRANTARSSG